MKKKSWFTLLPVAAAFLLAACDGGSYEVHNTRFFDIPSGGMTYYADETLDSCGLESYDSWSASTDATDWLSFSPTEREVAAGYRSVDWFDVTPAPNTTGRNRAALIKVDSYNDISLYVQQSANLNIGRPTGMTEDGTDLLNFTLDVNPKGTRDSVSFTIYSDTATLKGDAGWAVPTDTAFSRGSHTVYLDVSPNQTGNRRQTSFVLTSAGVSNTIRVTQDIPTTN